VSNVGSLESARNIAAVAGLAKGDTADIGTIRLSASYVIRQNSPIPRIVRLHRGNTFAEAANHKKSTNPK
jgi:hypothetical protein